VFKIQSETFDVYFLPSIITVKRQPKKKYIYKG